MEGIVKKFVPALLVATFVLAACAQAPTPVAVATRTPMPTFTPTPDATATPVLAPTKTPTPEPTATPTPEGTPTATPTNTPSAKPVAVIRSQTANVRGGPSTAYAIIGRVSSGQRYDIVGKNADGSWWQICCVGGQQGWITGDLVATEGDTGSVAVATNIPAPPVQPTRPPAPPRQPTPTSPPAPPPPPPQPTFPFSLVRGSETCAPNAGTTYFNGFVRYRNNTPRNGVCVHIAFFGPRQTKCSGCGGVGDGVWGFSPFGAGVPPAGTPVEIFVVECPSGFPEGGQNEGTGFGTLTPLSEKFTYTIKGGVQCTGITFVGD